MMDLGTTCNHLRANPLQPTNSESSKSATHRDDESTKFASLVGHHVAPDCCSSVGSRPARCRRSSCGALQISKTSHTKWVTSGASQTSMSLCTLKNWVLSLCFLLSTIQPQVIVSAVKVTDSPAGPGRPASGFRRRGEFRPYNLIWQIISNRLGNCFESRLGVRVRSESLEYLQFSNCGAGSPIATMYGSS